MQSRSPPTAKRCPRSTRWLTTRSGKTYSVVEVTYGSGRLDRARSWISVSLRMRSKMANSWLVVSANSDLGSPVTLEAVPHHQPPRPRGPFLPEHRTDRGDGAGSRCWSRSPIASDRSHRWRSYRRSARYEARSRSGRCSPNRRRTGTAGRCPVPAEAVVRRTRGLEHREGQGTRHPGTFPASPEEVDDLGLVGVPLHKEGEGALAVDREWLIGVGGEIGRGAIEGDCCGVGVGDLSRL